MFLEHFTVDFTVASFFQLNFSLSLVVLLDTTAVLGELSWKTYPVNGVSNISSATFEAYT